MEPARTIIDSLGGPTVVSRALTIHRTAIYYWLRPRKRGRGTGGVIPFKYRAPLIAHARAHGIRLRPGDFEGRLGQE
jgi:hypothetical protein